MNPSILMLEHDEDDRYITQSYFDEHNFKVSLTFVANSGELKNYLSGAKNGKVEMPSLILLNYHASPHNAVAVLKDLKADISYRHIPVVVLSGSVHKDIIRQCYDEGASSFIQKPSLNNETDRKITNFFKYWFQTVELA